MSGVLSIQHLKALAAVVVGIVIWEHRPVMRIVGASSSLPSSLGCPAEHSLARVHVPEGARELHCASLVERTAP
jgi:hypothetical protein